MQVKGIFLYDVCLEVLNYVRTSLIGPCANISWMFLFFRLSRSALNLHPKGSPYFPQGK